MAETEMRTLTCPGPPEHEFQIPKGRGRPPRYCEEHNPKNSDKKEESKVADPEKRPRPGPGNKSEGEKKEDAPRQGPPGRRPAPRVSGQEKRPLDTPTPEAESEKPAETETRRPPAVGTPDTKSRSKAESAAKRTNEHNGTVDPEGWPLGSDGRPMAKITMTASELVPTGQYANVSVGPAQITALVDLSRDASGGYFTDQERTIMASALNELAEVVEHDVIGVQRNLVLESMQEQLASKNGNS